ncbi:hypothetical protein SELMODRAFT_107193, partial [Selaginella moellendorffii]
LVAAVGWNVTSDLYSCGDDYAIWCWNRDGKPILKNIDSISTDLQCYPLTSHWNRTGSGSDIFVVSCIDGSLHISNRTGKEEKRVQAHAGSILCVRWSTDAGSALATGGEDGIVKIWSCSGMLRSTLAQSPCPIYALAWSPSSDQVLFACQGRLIIKSFQSSIKESHWDGHNGLILAVDWNYASNLLTSGGEDGVYKVWDYHGRMIYQSSKIDDSITSVAWCPSGEFFAVGSFNTLWLCDKTGWVLWKEKLSAGSVLRISWSNDGAQLAGAGANGFVVFGQIVDRKLEWLKLSATLRGCGHLRVYDMVTNNTTDLEFCDRVVQFRLEFRHLIVATTNQCYIYSVSNLNAPHVIDVKYAIILIKLCQRYFMIIDSFVGLQLFTYDGRHLSSPKCQGLRPEFLLERNVAISTDTVAFIDTSDHRLIRFLDASTGKLAGEPFRHTVEIKEIALNQVGTIRRIAFIDRNQDLFITPVYHKHEVFKLATIVDNVRWNDEADIIAAIADQKLIVWYCPLAAFVDRDLLHRVKVIKECDLGKNPKIRSFVTSSCILRRTDGAIVSSYICPYPFVLFQHVNSRQWEYAAQLCRFVKEDLLWACLATMAVDAQELNIAEEAYAALDEVDKVQFMLYLKDLPVEEARQAELALFKRHPDKAESILLQAGLTYRAIHMNLKLFNWDRLALELAVLHKVHIDTVMWYRQHYLMRIKAIETKEQFLHFKDQVKIDPQKINAKIHQEMLQEGSRQAARK